MMRTDPSDVRARLMKERDRLHGEGHFGSLPVLLTLAANTILRLQDESASAAAVCRQLDEIDAALPGNGTVAERARAISADFDQMSRTIRAAFFRVTRASARSVGPVPTLVAKAYEAGRASAPSIIGNPGTNQSAAQWWASFCEEDG